MSDELKPCPFCGVEIEAVERRGRAGLIYWCPKCACSQTKLEKWQSRPLEDTLRKQLEVANDLLIRLEIATNLSKSIYETPLHAFNAVHNEIIKALAEIAKIGGEK